MNTETTKLQMPGRTGDYKSFAADMMKTATDAETLMTECLEREQKQREEIMATTGTIDPTPIGAEVPEHRATAFVASLQQARIDALEKCVGELVEESSGLWSAATTSLAILEQHDRSTADAIRDDYRAELKRSALESAKRL